MESKNKILIVDDDAAVRNMYSEVFRSEGFEVEEAFDGLDGLEKAVKNPPDIIFTGIIMPRLDGFQLKDALSKNVPTASVPVVMSSHMGRLEDQKLAKEMGAADFIVLNMVSPRETVERTKAILGAGKYLVKINSGEMEAQNLARDLHLPLDFKCSYCQTDLVLLLRVSDTERQEFQARLFCPKCNEYGMESKK
jgi:PleD family two-component response regulator